MDGNGEHEKNVVNISRYFSANVCRRVLPNECLQIGKLGICLYVHYWNNTYIQKIHISL